MGLSPLDRWGVVEIKSLFVSVTVMTNALGFGFVAKEKTIDRQGIGVITMKRTLIALLAALAIFNTPAATQTPQELLSQYQQSRNKAPPFNPGTYLTGILWDYADNRLNLTNYNYNGTANGIITRTPIRNDDLFFDAGLIQVRVELVDNVSLAVVANSNFVLHYTVAPKSIVEVHDFISIDRIPVHCQAHSQACNLRMTVIRSVRTK